jgi:hypothetical protein
VSGIEADYGPLVFGTRTPGGVERGREKLPLSRLGYLFFGILVKESLIFIIKEYYQFYSIKFSNDYILSLLPYSTYRDKGSDLRYLSWPV